MHWRAALSASEAHARHRFVVECWVTGCGWLVRTADTPKPPQSPIHLFRITHFLRLSVSLSLPPLTLIMALGPSERPTEVNTPQRRGAIVYEAEVKMSG